MSVISVRESWKGRGGSNEYGKARDHTRVFDVVVDSRYDDETTILADPRIPAPYSGHPADQAAYAKKGKADNEQKHWSRWTATIEYATAEKKDDADEDNPLDRRAKIVINTHSRQKPMVKARKKQKDGQFTEKPVAVLNAAGKQYARLPEIGDDVYHATIEKNVSQAPEWLLDYKNALNSDSFTLRGLTIPAGVAYMLSVGIGDIQKENDVEFFTLRFEMLLDKDGHDVEVLETGLEELISESTEGDGPVKRNYRKCVDSEGVPMTEPALLDENGRQLEDDAEEVFTTYRPQKEKPFGSLPLA